MASKKAQQGINKTKAPPQTIWSLVLSFEPGMKQMLAVNTRQIQHGMNPQKAIT